ncbi:MAG: hypothetical protein ACWA41_11700 [Putridiphycobacter sp.]
MQKLLIIFLFLGVQFSSSAQYFNEKNVQKILKADKIKMDEGNGDGVFLARSKKTKKWGMFQYISEKEIVELIPMAYDKINYFPFNGAFTAVYLNGKVGFYTSYWSYGDKAKQTVKCLYEDYQRFNVDNQTYLAVKKNGKWGWVDWFTGEEKSEFIYDQKEDLPRPKFDQKSW